jgi:hypothetical protein
MDEKSDKSITRRDLPAVVKRAAELAFVADDVDEQLPEEEVIRIAAELGLAERHVRQALYEGVKDEPEPGLLDRQFGTPRIMAARAVPLPPDRARRALEDYLVTHEYLQIVRRQADSTTFEPAVDPMSKFARAFQRSSRHQLASASGIEICIRSLETGWSHARIRALYEDDRQSKVVRGSITGVLLGLPAGAFTAMLIGNVTAGLLIPEAGVAAGAVAGIAAFSSIVMTSLASARKQWRRWRERTQDQAEAVLDRLEKGDDLRPPPSPWLRKLQMKFGR